MTLSSQVVSLPLAKRLRELGVVQDSYFKYYDGVLAHKLYLTGGGEVGKSLPEVTPAYTASELMDLMPDGLSKKVRRGVNNYYRLTAVKILDTYVASYDFGADELVRADNVGTLADALALMLIHLIENDYDTKDFKP